VSNVTDARLSLARDGNHWPTPMVGAVPANPTQNRLVRHRTLKAEPVSSIL